MKKIKIHFVCLGNAYRSRLAEAYAKSLNLGDFEFSSSGLAAAFHPQPLAPQTAAVMHKHNLESFMTKSQQQTTAELLKTQDLIVFMHHDIYRDAVNDFALDTRQCMYWSVEDLWQSLLKSGIDVSDVSGSMALAEQTFELIKQHVDHLASDITGSSWIDIVDEDNKQLGFRFPISLANKRGLWHRGIHALVVTADHMYVAEKRSKTIIFAPGMIDLSAGGGFEPGEHPVTALMRELKEELGIVIHPSQAQLLEIRKFSNYHPKYKRYARGFTYSYLVRLTDPAPIFKLQTSEVAEVKLLSASQIKKLIRSHRLKKLGRLNYQYKFYKDTLDLAEKVKAAS